MAANIKIIDVYSANRISFQQMVADGFVGVIFKAGQGMWPDVPRVKKTWWQEAKSAGLMRGWYWLKDARYKPSLEFEALQKATGLDFGELGMWIDVEKPVISMKERDYNRLPYRGYKFVYDLMYRVQQTGASGFNERLPGVYTSPGAFKLILSGASTESQKWFAQAPLWTAQYYWFYREGISRPVMYGQWQKEVWWQYRENPDHNIFNGTQAEFEAFHSFEYTPPTPEEPAEFPRLIVITQAARGGLRVRSGPGTTFSVVDSLFPNNKEEVSELVVVDGNEWVKIGTAQWIAKTYNGTIYAEWAD